MTDNKSGEILIIEDDKDINDLLATALSKAGYRTRQAWSGTEGELLLKLDMEAYALVLLDLMLPGLSGEKLLARIRQMDASLPVIILTAKDELDEKINLLVAGADDYITKPFSLAVLRARVNTQLRNRTAQMQKESAKNTQIWEGSIWKFDFTNMRFTVSGQKVELSKTEQKLLALLVQHVGMTVPRETLMDRIWIDGAVYVDENALSVAIKRLRDKLQAKEQIRTVYGIGYVWDCLLYTSPSPRD